MTAVTARRYGGPEVHVVEQLPVPTPGADEVLVEVRASSLNALDWHVLRSRRAVALGLRSMGRHYADAEQLESVYTTMFDAVADDDSMDSLVEEQMVINFRLDDPAADIWVDGRARPVVTTFAPIDGVEASLTATLSADSMHELLLGTLPLGKAMLFRKLKVSGSKSKAMRLESLLHACQAVYPDIAADVVD